MKKGVDPADLSAAHRPIFPLLLVAFLSGMSCLAYELVWSRYLSLILGISAYAVAAVVASFMVGTALGSWHFGRVLDRRSGRWALVWLEAGIGASLLASPWIYEVASALGLTLLRSFGDGAASRYAVRFGMAFLAMLGPTFLMGGTFPALVRLIPSRAAGRAKLGVQIAQVYAWNTLGGVAGAFATGFWLVRWLGMSNTLRVGALAACVAAAIAWLAARRTASAQDESPATVPPVPNLRTKIAPPAVPSDLHARWFTVLVIIASGVMGFTGLALEVYWTRLLSWFFRDSIYDLTIVLAAFLTGIGLGSWIVAKLSRWIRRPGVWLAATQVGIGLAAVGGLWLTSDLPYWINDLQTNKALVESYGASYWTAAVLSRFGYAFALLLVPTCLFGMAFPLAARICAGDGRHVSRAVGRLSAVNTAGSALGALAAGLVLLPELGMQKSIVLMAAVNLAVGVVLLLAAPGLRRPQKWMGASACVAAGLVALLTVPAWDKLRMSASFFEPHQAIEDLVAVEFYREDACGVTSVVQESDGLKRLITNRLYGQNTSAMMGLEDHRRLGQIPMLLHPHPERALLIGLGAGISLRGVCSQNPAHVDCVEISGSVIDAARLFARENGGVLDDPRVHLIVDDARDYVDTTNADYDVIIGDILHPMSSGSSNVFSAEYFARCRDRLRPGGLFCQWLPAHQLAPDEVKIVLRTMRAVFPHVSVWYGMIGENVPVIGCLGTRDPLTLDAQALAAKFQNQASHRELAEVCLDSAGLLLSHFVMADEAVDAFSAGVPLNTDDRPVIEFLVPRHAVTARELGVRNLLALDEAKQSVLPYLKEGTMTGNAFATMKAHIMRYVSSKQTILRGFKTSLAGDVAGQVQAYQEALKADPGNEDLQTILRDYPN